MTFMTRRTALGLTVALAASGAGPAGAFAETVIIERQMPAVRVEVIPTVPAGKAWVPGHWVWRGAAWVWVPGHVVVGAVPPMPAEIVEVRPAPPTPRHFWVKGHYAWEGAGWVWHPGHWAR